MIAVLQKKEQVFTLTMKNSTGSQKLVVVFLVLATFHLQTQFQNSFGSLQTSSYSKFSRCITSLPNSNVTRQQDAHRSTKR